MREVDSRLVAEIAIFLNLISYLLFFHRKFIKLKISNEYNYK